MVEFIEEEVHFMKHNKMTSLKLFEERVVLRQYFTKFKIIKVRFHCFLIKKRTTSNQTNVETKFYQRILTFFCMFIKFKIPQKNISSINN